MLKLIDNKDYQYLIDHVVSTNNMKSLAIALLAFTGGRANEILSITTKSINIQKGVAILSLKSSKGGKSRTIQLPSELYARVQVLRDLLAAKDCTLAAVICSGSNRIRTAYELLRRHFIQLQVFLFGEVKHTMHSLRHTMATRAFTNGFDIMQVKAILGHASLSSTGHYLAEYENSFVMDKIHSLVRAPQVLRGEDA